MRFRLATRPPLRPLKAWFDVPNDDSIIDIKGLKSQIRSRLRQFTDYEGPNLSSAEIALFIDDFELLDDSSLDVVKENDLVHINKRHLSLNLKKRRAVDDNDSIRKKRHRSSVRQRQKASNHPASSAAGSSEDESTDSSDTSDTSDSESSSSSDSSASSTSTTSSVSASSSSSSSDSSLAVEVKSSRLRPPVKASANSDLPTHRVSPGGGKRSTQRRNARRRIKHLYEREKKQLEQATAQALRAESVNSVPLGTKSNTVPDVQAGSSKDSESLLNPLPAEHGSPIEGESLVTTLKNKNKRKGFRKIMAGVTAQRLIFTASAGPPPGSASTSYSAASTMSATPNVAARRLVTPSEKQAQGLLPSNMFVTSVEVESKNWDRRKKKQQRIGYAFDEGDYEFQADEAPILNDDVPLHYGEPEIDWASIDRVWDTMKNVTDVASLEVGSVVGWKALAINPATFSPETLVHLGRVKEIKHDTSLIIVESVQRPGADNIAFGASTINGGAEAGGEDASGGADEGQTYTFKEALSTPWKLVTI